jgi:hypothetical protein
MDRLTGLLMRTQAIVAYYTHFSFIHWIANAVTLSLLLHEVHISSRVFNRSACSNPEDGCGGLGLLWVSPAVFTAIGIVVLVSQVCEYFLILVIPYSSTLQMERSYL